MSVLNFRLTLYNRTLPSPHPAKKCLRKKGLKLRHDIPPIPCSFSLLLASLRVPASILPGAVVPSGRGARNSLGEGESPSREAWTIRLQVLLTRNLLGSSGENAKARAVAAGAVAKVPAEAAELKLAGANLQGLISWSFRSVSILSDFDKVRRTRPPGRRPRSVWSVRPPAGVSRAEVKEEIREVSKRWRVSRTHSNE